MRLTALAAALLLLTATATAAQPTAPPFGLQAAEPATPERVAAARQEADALIAAAEAANLFENITQDASPTVRHTRSGLVCSFNAGSSLNRVLIFPQPLARGEDVGCNTERDGTSVTYYASRYGTPTTLDEQLEIAVRGIRGRFPDAQASEVQVQMNGGGGEPAPEHRSASFLVTGPEGQRLVTRASVAIVGEWVIKQRMSAPAEEAMAADLMGEMMFVTLLRELQGGGPPAAAGNAGKP